MECQCEITVYYLCTISIAHIRGKTKCCACNLSKKVYNMGIETEASK